MLALKSFAFVVVVTWIRYQSAIDPPTCTMALPLQFSAGATRESFRVPVFAAKRQHHISSAAHLRLVVNPVQCSGVPIGAGHGNVAGFGLVKLRVFSQRG